MAPPLVGPFFASVPAHPLRRRGSRRNRATWGFFRAERRGVGRGGQVRDPGYRAKLPTARRQGGTPSRAVSAQRVCGIRGSVEPYFGDSRTGNVGISKSSHGNWYEGQKPVALRRGLSAS